MGCRSYTEDERRYEASVPEGGTRWMEDIADDPVPLIPGVIRELRRSTGETVWEP